MMLKEIFAKDIDLSEYDKKILVNILLSDDDGLNIKSLYTIDKNPANIKKSKEYLLKYKFIKESNKKNFFNITKFGIDSLTRSGILDLNGKMIEINSSKYYYDSPSDQK